MMTEISIFNLRVEEEIALIGNELLPFDDALC